MTSAPQRAVLDGAQVTAHVQDAGLDISGSGVDRRVIDWLDVDGVVEGDHRVRLDLAGGGSVELKALGTTHDGFMADLRAARRRVRMAALTMATGEPLVSYLSRDPAGPVDVHVYAKALVVEPRSGQPTAVPLPLVDRVDRDGYTLTIVSRGLEPLVVRALGATTDEFLQRVDTARRELQAATTAAYGGYDPALAGLPAPDGWALTAGAAGSHWASLHAMAIGGSRGEQVGVLEGLAKDRLAIGLFTDGGAQALPFVLAPVGRRVAVEAADTDDRATFVFDAPDVERLNAVLLLTSFRREALFLPDDQLGRWAVAVRTWAVVRDARACVVARVVHDANWAAGVRAALAG